MWKLISLLISLGLVTPLAQASDDQTTKALAENLGQWSCLGDPLRGDSKSKVLDHYKLSFVAGTDNSVSLKFSIVNQRGDTTSETDLIPAVPLNKGLQGNYDQKDANQKFGAEGQYKNSYGYARYILNVAHGFSEIERTLRVFFRGKEAAFDMTVADSLQGRLSHYAVRGFCTKD